MIVAAIRLSYTITQTMMWSVVIPFGLNVLLLVVYSSFIQESPLALVQRTVEHILQVAQARMPLPESSSEADIMATMKSMSQVILTILPAMMVLNFLFSNVVNYVVVRWYCQWGQPSFTIDPEDLGLWRLTDYLVWVFLASGAMLLLPSTVLSVVGRNVFILTLALYLLHGIAIAIFWLRRLPLPTSGRWLLALAVFVFAGPLCLMTCIAAGLFDIWLDFRRQRQQPLAS